MKPQKTYDAIISNASFPFSAVSITKPVPFSNAMKISRFMSMSSAINKFAHHADVFFLHNYYNILQNNLCLLRQIKACKGFRIPSCRLYVAYPSLCDISYQNAQLRHTGSSSN